MRLLIQILGLVFLSSACSKEEPGIYSGKQLEYALYQVNVEYAYSGKVIFSELLSGEIEVKIQLIGERGDDSYFFPAHLHYGAFGDADAPMAAMLNPVDMQTLESVTILGKLVKGEILKFDDLHQFDGHVKVHLADEGPDYHLILVAGNIGSNLLEN